MSLAKALSLISIIDSSSLWDWDRIQVHCSVIASRGTWCSCFTVGFACYSWWLPPPRWLGAARIVERRKVLVSGFDRGDCEWFLTFPRRRAKRTLVDCSWLVWSSSCVGCASPYWGFGVWCQLAREPPSVWIATTRTSLPTSKWTSVKNLCVHHWFRGDRSSLLFIFAIDWFIHLHGGITLLITLFTLPQTSWQAL